MVNETGSQGSDEIDVTDELRYEQLLETRKNRRAVNAIAILILIGRALV